MRVTVRPESGARFEVNDCCMDHGVGVQVSDGTSLNRDSGVGDHCALPNCSVIWCMCFMNGGRILTVTQDMMARTKAMAQTKCKTRIARQVSAGSVNLESVSFFNMTAL